MSTMESQVVTDGRKRAAAKDAKNAAIERRADIRGRIGALRLQRNLVGGRINAGHASSIGFNDKGALEFFLGDLIRSGIDRLCGDQRGISLQERAGQLARIDAEIAQLEHELRTVGG